MKIDILISVFVTALLTFFCVSCSDDLTTESHDTLHFTVSEADIRMHLSNRTGKTEGMEKADVSPTEVFTLQDKNPCEALFVHTSLANSLSMSYMNGEKVGSRATPVEISTFHEAFGVLGYAYEGLWNESHKPDYMYDISVTKASSWTTGYRWPGSGKNVRFFAYAPYGASGVSLSEQTATGTPSITYTVPMKVADQKDLLAAVSKEMAGDANITVPLTFCHILTGVRFITSDSVMAGKITKITLKGIYGTASHKIGSGSWYDYGAITDFSQNLSVSLDGGADREITSSTATFMMLPQKLPSGASIEVDYTDELTHIQRTLTASIGGSEWPIGKIITYRFSTSSIEVIPDFVVIPPDNFPHTGDRKTYTVTSNLTVSRSGDETRTVPAIWDAEFVEDDGNGGYNVIPRPDWLTDFTVSGSGGTEMSYAAEVAAQSETGSIDPHNETLQTATPVVGIYDLSTKGGKTKMNTANCYIINAPGTYSLPLVYGNAVKNGARNEPAYLSGVARNKILRTFVNHLGNGITDPYIYQNTGRVVDNAMLVWQDAWDLVTNIRLDSERKNLLFDVQKSFIKQGNAIVAVRDNNGAIMWSWHIWVTDYVPGLEPTIEERYDPAITPRDKVVTNFQNKKYTMMPVNIGWCQEGEIVAYKSRSVKVRFKQHETNEIQVITIFQTPYSTDEVHGNNLYFQFGRKDPMLGGDFSQKESGVTANKACYSSGYEFRIASGSVTIDVAIRNPHSFYTEKNASTQDWCSNSYENLWDNSTIAGEVIKTIYDPSPAGYCLPPEDVFTGLTYNGKINDLVNDYTRLNTSYLMGEYSAGFELYCNKMLGKGNHDKKGGTFFLPALNYRSREHGMIPSTSQMQGFYWTALPDGIKGCGLNFAHRNIKPKTATGRAMGISVRPVREEN